THNIAGTTQDNSRGTLTFAERQAITVAHRRCRSTQTMPWHADDAVARRRCRGTQTMTRHADDAVARRRCRGTQTMPSYTGICRSTLMIAETYTITMHLYCRHTLDCRSTHTLSAPRKLNVAHT